MTEQQPEQVISTPVGAGNLDQELTQAKRGLGKVTIGLGIGVLVLVAFFGGVWVHSATAGTSTAPAAQAARPGGGAGGYGGRLGGGTPPSGAPGAPGGGGGRGGTAGTISRVEGNTVYVKLQDGTEVKVSTTDQTKVDVTQPGKLADLTPGSSVVVQGQRAEDNSVQAQTITKRPTTP
jgi:hypothetical protein